MEVGVELGLCSFDGVFGGSDASNFLFFEPQERAGSWSTIKMKADQTTLSKHPYRSVTFWPFVQAYEQDQACLSRPQDLTWKSEKTYTKYGNGPTQEAGCKQCAGGGRLVPFDPC
jgi:hypothetical protein